MTNENYRNTLNRRQVLKAGALATVATVGMASPAVFAQAAWPSKPIRFVVPFAPGGTSEIVARSVAAELTKQLGVSVFVENKPGGAGVVAMQDVAKAAPDGHTIILTHVGTLAVNPYMLESQPYDVKTDTFLGKLAYEAHTGPQNGQRDWGMLRWRLHAAKQRLPCLE